jgi:hypothetical protein
MAFERKPAMVAPEPRKMLLVQPARKQIHAPLCALCRAAAGKARLAAAAPPGGVSGN